MKLVCKYTHNVFIYGSTYDVKEINESAGTCTLMIGSGLGLCEARGSLCYFHTVEEWRDKQISKLLDK
jgi:hypothetical protein